MREHYEYISSNGKVSLTIDKIADDTYRAVNNFTDITIKAIQIDEYRTQTECIEHKTKGKDGKFRKSKKLMEHNTSWLLYMLEEYGFIKKRIPIK